MNSFHSKTVLLGVCFDPEEWSDAKKLNSDQKILCYSTFIFSESAQMKAKISTIS
jgi:hypothetical protein